MNPELKQLLIISAICIPVGLLAAIIVRKSAPNFCKNYAKSCVDKKWWLFLFGLLFFLGLSVMAFATSRPYHGCLFIAFALLQLYSLLKFGFRPISPEMEAAIDASDPTRIFPLNRINKRANKAEMATPRKPSD
jgi:hypothetical protein